MFGSSQLNTSSTFGNVQTATVNPMKDFEVASPPDDTVSAMEFSPATIPQNFLVAGSWDSSVCHCERKMLCGFGIFFSFGCRYDAGKSNRREKRYRNK